MREQQLHLLVVVTATVDHTRQGLTVDYDPQRKFDQWMDEQLRDLDVRWARIYPTFDPTAGDRGQFKR